MLMIASIFWLVWLRHLLSSVKPLRLLILLALCCLLFVMGDRSFQPKIDIARISQLVLVSSQEPTTFNVI
jgi:hypothetical protein